MIQRLQASIVLIGSVTLFPCGLAGETILVPGDAATIPAALEMAGDGDEVLVARGEYILNEPLDPQGKAVILRSAEGPRLTFIRMDPAVEGPASLLHFHSGETLECRIEGFTLRGGKGILLDGRRYGGAVLCEASSPTLVGNILKGNAADQGGAVACLEGSSPLIWANRITGNVAGEDGGGVSSTDSSPAIVSSHIVGNESGGIGGGIFLRDSNASMLSNIVAGNRSGRGGAGIACLSSDAEILGNTITENADGGIRLDRSDATIADSIVWGNGGIDLDLAESPDVVVATSDIGTVNDPDSSPPRTFCLTSGNICADPLFAEPGRWDDGRWFEGRYSIRPGSPCVDAGDPEAPEDPDGTRRDMGAVPSCQGPNCFIRGDANRDGIVSVTDAATVSYIAFGETEALCPDAADVDDNGVIDVDDTIYLLIYFFRRGPEPFDPFPHAGFDPTDDDELGCEETITPPVARFSANAGKGFSPLTVQFSNESDTGGDPYATYLWEFGDGATSENSDPSHVYEIDQLGGVSFTVRLTVRNEVGEDTEVREDLITLYLAPKANFAWEPRRGASPLVVTFTNQSQGDVVSFLWEFGDGTMSEASNPTHIYDEAGVYPVRLTARGPLPSDPRNESVWTVQGAILAIAASFIRGDADRNGRVSVNDVVEIFAQVLEDKPTLCPDASDANDDGVVDALDPIFLLQGILRRVTIPLPYPGHGLDETYDMIGCEG